METVVFKKTCALHECRHLLHMCPVVTLLPNVRKDESVAKRLRCVQREHSSRTPRIAAEKNPKARHRQF